MLGIPLIAGDPNSSQLFSTKSGSKRVFQKAEIPIPICAFDIYSRNDLFS